MLLACTAHIAFATSAHTYVEWRRLVLADPENLKAAAALSTFSWSKSWASMFPYNLTSLLDWELVAGAPRSSASRTRRSITARRSIARCSNAQLETRLVEAQLQTLQSQLHPHFLFNTLHAISA